MSNGEVVSMPGSPLVVRPLGLHDVPSILAIQRVAYQPRYLESAESFASKIEAGPQCCFGAFRGPSMIAYLVSMPMATMATVPLDAPAISHTLVGEASVIYIHDLAADPGHRGSGVGDVLLVHLYETAQRHRISSFRLVAVQNSVGYWQSRGFTVDEAPAPEGYGPEAVLMSRR